MNSETVSDIPYIEITPQKETPPSKERPNKWLLFTLGFIIGELLLHLK